MCAMLSMLCVTPFPTTEVDFSQKCGGGTVLKTNDATKTPPKPQPFPNDLSEQPSSLIKGVGKAKCLRKHSISWVEL